MRETWVGLVDSVLRPARPHLERCDRERAQHLEGQRLVAERRAAAIADVVARIEDARAAVFASGDGVVTSQMFRLENEWRRLSRPDPEAGMMDLWARIAPRSWIDHKRWRGGGAAAQLDAAVKLAADVDGVEAAESAVRSLRSALDAWGIRIGPRVRWRVFERDADCTSELLAEPLRAALAALSASDVRTVALARAHQLEGEVTRAVLARHPERPLLANGIGHAAFVDFVRRAAAVRDRPDPTAPLRALWATGYVLSSVDTAGVTLEIP